MSGTVVGKDVVGYRGVGSRHEEASAVPRKGVASRHHSRGALDVSAVRPLVAIVGEGAAGEGHIPKAARSIQATVAIIVEGGVADRQGAALASILVMQVETIGTVLDHAVVDCDRNCRVRR